MGKVTPDQLGKLVLEADRLLKQLHQLDVERDTVAAAGTQQQVDAIEKRIRQAEASRRQIGKQLAKYHVYLL